MSHRIRKSMRQVAGAFRAGLRAFLHMVTGKGSDAATFEEVMAEAIAKLQDLQAHQQRTMDLLRAVVAKKKGMDDVRKQIKEI